MAMQIDTTSSVYISKKNLIEIIQKECPEIPAKHEVKLHLENDGCNTFMGLKIIWATRQEK